MGRSRSNSPRRRGSRSGSSKKKSSDDSSRHRPPPPRRRLEGDLFDADWLNESMNEARGLRRMRKIAHGVNEYLVDHLRGELDSQVIEIATSTLSCFINLSYLHYLCRQSSKLCFPCWASGSSSGTSLTTSTTRRCSTNWMTTGDKELVWTNTHSIDCLA